MNSMTIDTPYGTRLEYRHYDGVVYPTKRVDKLPSKDMCTHIQSNMEMDIREDDIYLATYEKAGTHWAWEILMMLKKGKVEYETQPKEYVFLDFRGPEHLDKVPSPRILNGHSPVKHTPRGLLEKGNKIVHVQRNPKDICVSLYNHVKSFDGTETETFSRFLHLFIGTYGVYHYYPWFKYVKEWERFTKENPDQILNIYYEDMKEDPVREIKKMDQFLHCGRSDELITQIAEACSFQNLKKANDDVKDHSFFSDKRKGSQVMYRKGEVGDWKNWFTVAENERMEAWLTEHLVDTNLKFRYEL